MTDNPPIESEDDMISRVVNLALDGLCTDGSHHKQWYLERIVETLNPDGYKLLKDRSVFEEGIAP